MKDLNSIFIFAQVAEVKSFTQAAKRMNITASAVSKTISRLESELGVRLFNRTTRTVNLTSDGLSFLQCCKSVLSQITEVEATLNSMRTSVNGRIRVHMPVGFGRRVIVPGLAAFCQKYPNITVDAELTDRVVDLVYEGIDVAIVVGDISDQRVISRKLCDLHFCACASPSYIKAHGQPKDPDDLVGHHCLAYMIPPSGNYREWKFTRNGCVVSKTIAGQLNMNSAESLLEAAVAGAGIVMLSTMVTGDAIRTGKLKVILRDYIAPGPAVSAVYLPNRILSPRVKAFVDFLQDLVPPNPPWEMKI
jgi:LysR family transcriptional regulator for bpeEF and oprC